MLVYKLLHHQSNGGIGSLCLLVINAQLQIENLSLCLANLLTLHCRKLVK